MLPSKLNQNLEHEYILSLCSINCQSLNIILIMPSVFLYSCLLLLLLLRFPVPAIKLKSPVIWNKTLSLFKFLEFLAVEFQSLFSCNFCAFFIALQNALVLQFSSFFFFLLSCYFVVQLSSYKFNVLCIYSLSLTHMMCRKREIIPNANA